ncbi:MAG TPA: LuxR family transcriptional regulator [Thermodesulforhabdus norvegica]|uniref:LuxR family transcriptional regulator n=1 Tax=Thermodesulforhabdus norvegica TaxID=39841 RepID=A0A7C1B116_9BACT|nr:LuxR family transcriptional regulator [Thermodesulforhabdus norvegica]
MANLLQNLKSGEVKLLFTIFEKLSTSQDQDDLRSEIAHDLLCLLKSDFLASFIWNQDCQAFEDVVFLNMSSDNIARYESYYRFCDPITSSLQKRRKATLVNEVMPQAELEKTEFFNDFLMADGLHHGINAYAYDGDLNIGDLRIWRARQRPDFGDREVALLDLLLPHFRNALRNARALSKAQEGTHMWQKLFDMTQTVLYLFDDTGKLIYRNSSAQAIEREFSKEAYLSFFKRIRALLKKDFSQTDWGPFFLSRLHVSPPRNPHPYIAVLARRASPNIIDRNLLIRKHHLSPREVDIALLVCKGLIDQEIASALDISFYTVRTHLKHIFTKLDVTTRSELIYVLLEDQVDISF